MDRTGLPTSRGRAGRNCEPRKARGGGVADRSATPTTSNAARRSKSAQPEGLRRQPLVSGVAPPRRAPGSTPSSSLLESGGLAHATRLTRSWQPGSEQPPAIALRPAQLEDCRSLWEWRNDPETREASFHTETVFFDDHRTWFESRIGSPDLQILIVLSPEGKEIGYVRFQLTGSDAEVSVALDPEERGKGYGPAAVRAASDELLAKGSVQRVIALIKHSNPASRQAFERAGFRFEGNETVGSEEVWKLILRKNNEKDESALAR